MSNLAKLAFTADGDKKITSGFVTSSLVEEGNMAWEVKIQKARILKAWLPCKLRETAMNTFRKRWLLQENRYHATQQ